MLSNHPSSAPAPDTAISAPLHRALGQSEKVQDKVEDAAEELSDVNSVLKQNVERAVPVVHAKDTLDRSEAVEIKMQEAAAELDDVNEALAAEVAERELLQDRVEKSESALLVSEQALLDTEAALLVSESALLNSQAAEALSSHRALHDAVTTLPNGTLFGDRLENALEQARRHQWRLAVLFLDLDGFKQINDTHGHHVGDRVLQGVATRLSDALRAGDSVGRRGGDEFLVLMLEVQDDASTIALASKLGACVAEPFDVDGISLVVGTSIGVAIFPDDADTGPELLKVADHAMYVAKKQRLGVSRQDRGAGQAVAQRGQLRV